MKLLKLGVAASLIAGAAFANASDIKYGVQLGASSGGDVLSSTYNTVTGATLDELKAGDGSYSGIYGLIPLTDNEVYVKLAINYMSGSLDSSTADSSFSRLPLDILAVKQINKLQLAAGITYHLNPELTFNSLSFDADNALGLIVEANYEVFDYKDFGFNLGARYTNIEYAFDGVSQKFDGSNFGFTAGVTF